MVEYFSQYIRKLSQMNYASDKVVVNGDRTKKVSQTLEGLTQRLQEIENNKDQETCLVEVLANATFGQMKKPCVNMPRMGNVAFMLLIPVHLGRFRLRIL